MIEVLEWRSVLSKRSVDGGHSSDMVNQPEWFACRKSTEDGSIQIIVPQKYLAAVVRQRHYSKLAMHPGAWRMYDSLGMKYSWPHMSTGVHYLMSQCQSCRNHQPSEKHHQILRLFPLLKLREFVKKDILGPLMWTRLEKWLTDVMTERFSRLTRAISVAMIFAPNILTVRSKD